MGIAGASDGRRRRWAVAEDARSVVAGTPIVITALTTAEPEAKQAIHSKPSAFGTSLHVGVSTSLPKMVLAAKSAKTTQPFTT